MSRPRFLFASYLLFKGLVLLAFSPFAPVALIPGLLCFPASALMALLEAQL